MYSRITNPETGRNVTIESALGKHILRNYLLILSGGAATPSPPMATLATKLESFSEKDKGSVMAFLNVMEKRHKTAKARKEQGLHPVMMKIKYDDDTFVRTESGHPSIGINTATVGHILAAIGSLDIKYAKFQEGIQKARAIKISPDLTADEKKTARTRLNLYALRDSFLQALMEKLNRTFGTDEYGVMAKSPAPLELKTGVNADGEAVWEKIYLDYIHEFPGKDAGGPGKRNIYMVRGRADRLVENSGIEGKLETITIPPFKLHLTNFRYIPNEDGTFFYEGT